MNAPYLPDIMQNVVGRINDAYQQRDQDPFSVFFEKGIYSQVAREMGSRKLQYPLIWLKMPYPEVRGKDFTIFATVTIDLWICIDTDWRFTQQEREDINFKPRLLPIYESLMYEIGRERGIRVKGPNKIDHRRIIRPFWGGGDENAPSVPNMFKKPIDAIWVNNLTFDMALDPCYDMGYGVNRDVNYPARIGQYEFYDDLELVVDGGRTTDPVSGQNFISIPFLAGKVYDVEQRGFGQLRQTRDVEIVPLPQGGFVIPNQLFSSGDTYFVKIRPILLNQ